MPRRRRDRLRVFPVTTAAPFDIPLRIERSALENRVLGEAIRRPRSVAQWTDAEWGSRYRLAIEHRVAPILYRRLTDAAIEAPAFAGKALRNEYYQCAAKNLVILEELERILASIRIDEASVLVLKGGALARELYSSPALRPMSDLDLLVHDEDFDEWHAALCELGYRDGVPEMAAGLDKSARFQVTMVGGPRDQVVVELHRSIVAGQGDWRAPDMDWFWEQSEPLVPNEDGRRVNARQLNPTANLIYLAAHAMLQHGASEMRILWLVDIDELIRRRAEGIDWDAAIEAAARFGWSGACAMVIDTLREWLATPVPERFRARFEIGPHRSRELLRSKASQPASRGVMVWRELACLEWRERLKMMGAIVFPSPSYLRWRYPNFGSLWIIGYPYRWMKVLWEAGRALRMPARPDGTGS